MSERTPHTPENPSPQNPAQPWNPDPERIIAEYQRLAYSAANAYRSSGVPLDDLRQEALLGLLDAARKYSPDKGTHFSTYAAFWIKKRLLQAVKRDARYISSEGGGRPPKETDYTDPVDSRADNDTSRDPRLDLPQGLSDAEREILTLCYRDQLTLSEIARRTGISVERVKQLRGKALRRIRAGMDPML